MSVAQSSEAGLGMPGVVAPIRPGQGDHEDNFAPLYLSGVGHDCSYHFLDLLARLFMLPVYGTAGMGQRTRYEIRIAALMLAVVACFEITAWSFVFHQFSNGGIRDMFLVFGAALLVSCAMTMLERSILVADVDVQGWDYFVVWIKILSRLAIILFVAFRITSQPVELVAFHPSIEQRMFQEDIRRNLAAAATETINNLQELQSRFDPLTTMDSPSSANDPRGVYLRSKRKIEQVQQTIDQDNSRIKLLSANIRADDLELIQARRRRDQADSDLAHLSGKPENGETTGNAARLHENKDREQQEISRLESTIASLHSRIDRTNAGIDELNKEKKDNEFTKTQALGGTAETSDSGGGVTPSIKDFDNQFDKFRLHAASLLEAKSPTDIPSQFRFARKDYTDVEQLVIVEDFRKGQPPFDEKLASAVSGTDNSYQKSETSRREMFDRNASKVVQVFDQDSAQLHTQGVEEARRMQIIAIGKYWMILGIAIVVPMVALIYKVTAGKELKNYYSARFQAGSFHPEALFQATTEEFLNNAIQRKHRR